MLKLLDGLRTVIDVAEALSGTQDFAFAGADEIAAILQVMAQHRIVRPVVELRFERKTMMKETRYLANPEVSFRQEGDDGGILFNADTDGLEVINPTAVEIWKTLGVPQTADDIVKNLCERCDDAPHDEVIKDVNDFLNALLTKRFIGIVENDI